eukprot:jgi/Phyca11/112455/e_gw1.22.571.1
MRVVGADLNDDDESYQHSSVVPVPIVVPILPPKLSYISHEALVKWEMRRVEYEAKMRARCRGSGEDYYDLLTQGVKESFDLNILSTFCSLRLRKGVADVTEDQLIAEVTALLGKVKNDDLPDIKALFARDYRWISKRLMYTSSACYPTSSVLLKSPSNMDLKRSFLALTVRLKSVNASCRALPLPF